MHKEIFLLISSGWKKLISSREIFINMYENIRLKILITLLNFFSALLSFNHIFQIVENIYSQMIKSNLKYSLVSFSHSINWTMVLSSNLSSHEWSRSLQVNKAVMKFYA